MGEEHSEMGDAGLDRTPVFLDISEMIYFYIFRWFYHPCIIMIFHTSGSETANRSNMNYVMSYEQ